MKKGQLYTRSQGKCWPDIFTGPASYDYVEVILVTGVLKGGIGKGNYAVWYVACGRCVNAVFNKCYGFPNLDDDGFGPWTPIQIPDLLRYLELPKKSILFDRLISGGCQ
jgi:hypothetical protein